MGTNLDIANEDINHENLEEEVYPNLVQQVLPKFEEILNVNSWENIVNNAPITKLLGGFADTFASILIHIGSQSDWNLHQDLQQDFLHIIESINLVDPESIKYKKELKSILYSRFLDLETGYAYFQYCFEFYQNLPHLHRKFRANLKLHAAASPSKIEAWFNESNLQESLPGFNQISGNTLHAFFQRFIGVMSVYYQINSGGNAILNSNEYLREVNMRFGAPVFNMRSFGKYFNHGFQNLPLESWMVQIQSNIPPPPNKKVVSSEWANIWSETSLVVGEYLQFINFESALLSSLASREYLEVGVIAYDIFREELVANIANMQTTIPAEYRHSIRMNKLREIFSSSANQKLLSLINYMIFSSVDLILNGSIDVTMNNSRTPTTYIARRDSKFGLPEILVEANVTRSWEFPISTLRNHHLRNSLTRYKYLTPAFWMTTQSDLLMMTPEGKMIIFDWKSTLPTRRFNDSDITTMYIMRMMSYINFLDNNGNLAIKRSEESLSKLGRYYGYKSNSMFPGFCFHKDWEALFEAYEKTEYILLGPKLNKNTGEYRVVGRSVKPQLGMGDLQTIAFERMREFFEQRKIGLK